MWAVYLRAFIADETGATAIEYGLLAMLVCLALIGSFTLFGDALLNLFDNGTAELLAAQSDTVN